MAALPPAGNVSRLLTKFGSSTNPPATSRPPLVAMAVGTSASAPNIHQSTSVRGPTSVPGSPTRTAALASNDAAASGPLDIGSYDGGFERENESRGQPVTGEAAVELALDSSVYGLAFHLLTHLLLLISSFGLVGTAPHANGI